MSSEDAEKDRVAWPRAPSHKLQERGTFLVTGSTYQKAHFFGSRARLRLLQHELLTAALKAGWKVEAWAVFSNHYHFVAHTPPDADDSSSLVSVLQELHSRTAIAINQFDCQPERKVWHSFWETQLTYMRSYLARLQYVHQNAVKHGLVREAVDYPWCSARWIEETGTPGQLRTLRSFNPAKVPVLDDYDVFRG